MVKYSFSTVIASVILLFSLVKATNSYSTGKTRDQLQNKRTVVQVAISTVSQAYINRLNLLEERIKELRIRSEFFSRMRTESANENKLTKNGQQQSGKKFHVPGTAYEGQDIDSWAKLQISPTAFDSVNYDDFLINIYEHSGNGRIVEKNKTSESRKYYYAPLAILDVWSARGFKNEITEQFEMEFSIELWNDDIQKQVTELIRNKHNITVKDTSIQIIPFKELILSSSSSIFRKKYKFTADTWVPYQQGKRAKFSLICESIERCKKIAQNIKDEPESFKSLRLQFRVDSEKAKTQKTNIRIQSIMRGNFMSKLTQEMPDAEFALLRENDAQQMLSESASNIIYDSFSDSDTPVIKPIENNQLMTFLKDNLMEDTKTMIEKQNDTRWGNVFWNEDNYRPDKLTKSFQDKYNDLNTTSKRDFINAFNNLDKLNIDTAISVPAIVDVKFNTDIEHGLGENHTGASLNKFLKESQDKVLWNGEKFVPKPMSFSRMNFDNMKNDKKLVNTEVTIKYSTATLLVEVNIPTQAEFVPPNQLIEMQKQVDAIAAKMNLGSTELKNFKVSIEQATEDMIDQEQAVENLYQEIDKKMQKSLDETLTTGIFIASRKPAFDAYRTTGFSNIGETITYDGVIVDVFSNLNPTQGIFTVPINGIYEITFHGISGQTTKAGLLGASSTTVVLMVNNKPITQANGAGETPRQMALSTILPLNANDKVACKLYNGIIYGADDNSLIFTHFTGQLLYSSTGGNSSRTIIS